ncbi:unnamed protein product [Pleuronectes platessa]|uniref:Uncharacterized protein n=1 Tax=Pleuronectes platessa TaxID=8262 RepID=A0A9N7TP45_PLEPL|nr:unnamed protein product [Pleuronectes platessa]
MLFVSLMLARHPGSSSSGGGGGGGGGETERTPDPPDRSSTFPQGSEAWLQFTAHCPHHLGGRQVSWRWKEERETPSARWPPNTVTTPTRAEKKDSISFGSRKQMRQQHRLLEADPERIIDRRLK